MSKYVYFYSESQIFGCCLLEVKVKGVWLHYTEAREVTSGIPKSNLPDAHIVAVGDDLPIREAPLVKPELEPAPFKVELDNGKYVVTKDAKGLMTATRHGEPWRDLAGDNLVYFLLCKIEELEETNNA